MLVHPSFRPDNGSDHRVRTIDLPFQKHAQAGLRVHRIVIPRSFAGRDNKRERDYKDAEQDCNTDNGWNAIEPAMDWAVMQLWVIIRKLQVSICKLMFYQKFTRLKGPVWLFGMSVARQISTKKCSNSGEAIPRRLGNRNRMVNLSS